MTDENRRKGLGRGLSALLEEDSDDYATIDRLRSTRDVPIEHLEPNPYQPRRRFDADELDSLVASIREKGILQPILVRRRDDDPSRYQIVAGERRWRAAQQAQLHEVPVVVKELSDSEALELALVENIQRQDLTPLEEAQGYKQLIDEFSHTQEQLAQFLGKSRSHIANTLRLLSLPEAVQEMLQDGRLTAGHARTLVTAEEPEVLARRIVEDGLTVRAAERLTQERRPARARRAPAPKDADTAALERELSQGLGLKVAINHRGTTGGEVRIHYTTLDQLDEICRRLSAHHGPI